VNFRREDEDDVVLGEAWKDGRRKSGSWLWALRELRAVERERRH
jgi:hypothetical protein